MEPVTTISFPIEYLNIKAGTCCLCRRRYLWPIQLINVVDPFNWCQHLVYMYARETMFILQQRLQCFDEETNHFESQWRLTKLWNSSWISYTECMIRTITVYSFIPLSNLFSWVLKRFRYLDYEHKKLKFNDLTTFSAVTILNFVLFLIAEHFEEDWNIFSLLFLGQLVDPKYHKLYVHCSRSCEFYLKYTWYKLPIDYVVLDYITFGINNFCYYSQSLTTFLVRILRSGYSHLQKLRIIEGMALNYLAIPKT